MNRIVLIGNGFDLAHGLKTNYKDFIDWYWENWGGKLLHGHNRIETDGLCSFKIKDNVEAYSWAYAFQGWRYKRENPFIPWNWGDVIKIVKEDKEFCDFSMSPFLESICNSLETKKWVEIENEYYRLLTKYALEDKSENDVYALNNQLAEMRGLLIDYLNTINVQEIKANSQIRSKLYSPIKEDDIAIGSKRLFDDYIDWCMKQEQDYWKSKMTKYGDQFSYIDVEDYKNNLKKGYSGKYPRPFMMPDNIMLLNFNYTKTASLYETDNFKTNYIHGRLEHFESVIFGYGDELDEKYKELQNSGNNDCLYNIKSIKYLESDNYRKVLDFIESDLFQVCIMGHSCGNSDRTLLNTLFEHRNCISIKPYFHESNDGTDNYLELVQNISRNFKDMKLMRDRVVNKTYCDKL